MSTKNKTIGGIRPEIQWIRAIGVTGVIIGHFWPELIRGGFILIDGFFVVSGFLITRILIRMIDHSGSFPVSLFWVGRARRILPAALVVLLFSSIMTFLFVPQNFWASFFSEIQASTLYFENWLLGHEAVNYFAKGRQATPVQNYWTLSFEEQAYFLFPFLFLGPALIAKKINKLSTRQLIMFCLIVVTIASFAYSVYDTYQNPGSSYFSTLGRLWQVTSGGILALIGTGVARPRLRAAVSWTAMAITPVLVLTYTAKTPYPGLAAVLPILAIVAIIWAGNPPSTGWMRWRPIQLTGDASYSLYLWHWPILILAPFVLERELNTPIKLVLLVIVFVVSGLSWRYIENPFRSGPRLDKARPRTILLLSLAGIAVVLATTFVALGVSNEAGSSYNKDAQQVLDSHPNCLGAAARDPRRPCNNPKLRLTVIPLPDQINQKMIDQLGPESTTSCPNQKFTSYKSVDKICQLGISSSQAKKHYALIGDSHSVTWRPAFQIAAKRRGWNITAAAEKGCPFSIYFYPGALGDFKRCASFKKDIVEFLTNHPEIDTVFIGNGTEIYKDKARWEKNVKGAEEQLRKLPPSIKKIIVIRDNPRVNSSKDNAYDYQSLIPSVGCINDALANKISPGKRCGLSRYLTLDNFPDPTVEAAKRAHDPRFSVIDLTNFFCDKSLCYPVIGGLLVDLITNHMAPEFSKTLAPYLLEEIDRLTAPPN